MIRLALCFSLVDFYCCCYYSKYVYYDNIIIYYTKILQILNKLINFYASRVRFKAK